MAIVKMDRIAIVGLTAEKSKMLKLLMKRGFVQIDDSGYLTEEEAFAGNLLRDGDDGAVARIEEHIQKTEQAMALLNALPRDKKDKKSGGGLFAQKPAYEDLTEAKVKELTAETLQILALQSTYQSLKGEENRLLGNQSQLIPWQKLDVPLDGLETHATRMILGTLPASANLAALREKLAEAYPETFLGEVDRDKRAVYAYVIAHKSVADDAAEAAKSLGFSPVAFDEQGTALSRIQAYETQVATVRQSQVDTIQEMKAFLPKLEQYRNLSDYYAVRRDELAILDNLVRTKETFYLEGWLPANKADGLAKELKSAFTCYIETQEATREDAFPVLLHNNAVSEPFETVTNMYSCPNSRDIDPTFIMSIFYIIFFGIMMGDAGYGILITLACIFVTKKAKLGRGQGNLIRMMIYCGISTTIWGFVFGSFLGYSIPGLINPLEDVMLLMGMSLLLGIVHIYTGLLIKGYMLLRDGDVKSFLFDIVFWLLLITGVCLVIIPVIAGPIGVASTVGKYLALVGAVGVVLTGGRTSKSIGGKIGNGLYSLYGITSYFGDILSYSRLMALCLSSGVIAQVVGLLGAMTGPVGAVIIGIVGHAINLFIGGLGAYVHTSRLQYVEFFAKFYEGGGKMFSPFRYQTKYTNIEVEEEM